MERHTLIFEKLLALEFKPLTTEEIEAFKQRVKEREEEFRRISKSQKPDSEFYNRMYGG